jgi:hypothetical protein
MIRLLRHSTLPAGLLAACIVMLVGTSSFGQDPAAATDDACTCADGQATCPICDQSKSESCASACPTSTVAMMDVHKTKMFSGPKANTGYAIHQTKDGKQMLSLSDDFVVPDTPAPHWQVVDSNGNVYLLNRLKIKEDKYNQTIVLPSYIQDVAKVQIWCSWAEALLGEAAFESAVR